MGSKFNSKKGKFWYDIRRVLRNKSIASYYDFWALFVCQIKYNHLILNILSWLILLFTFNKMTKSLTFTPIVLSQKKMKRIPSESSLATLNDSEQLKFDRNRKISESVKLDFIEMVTQRNFSMKNVIISLI
jgi:hypothetical protein